MPHPSAPPLLSTTQVAEALRSRLEKDAERAEEQETWNRVTLARRSMELAAAEEDYVAAAGLRDRAAALRARLSPGAEAVLAAADRLRSGSDAERRCAAEELGRLGDERGVPSLVSALRDGNRAVTLAAEKACWDVFQRSHSADVDAKLKEGVELMLSPADFPRAREAFTEVIGLAPGFAEGYNKRATVHYLMRAYKESIDDCRRTIELQPAHFGALSGLGLCYVGLQQLDAALAWFRRALDVNPHMEQIRSYASRLEEILAESSAAPPPPPSEGGGAPDDQLQ